MSGISGTFAARHFRSLLWSIIVLGTLIRLEIAFHTRGVPFDLHSLTLVGASLLGPEPFHVYSVHRWPYPPGYFPFILGAHWVAVVTGVAFEQVIRVPAIAADAALAYTVSWLLGKRGADRGKRLGAAALVAFGPSFIGVSAFHGQLDAVAILSAVLAMAIWTDSPRGSARACGAGLLIGVGAAVKTVPILMLIALLPGARSRREAVIVVASAVAVPLIAVMPFIAANAADTIHELTYRGFPGQGGISLLVQPDLAGAWIHNSAVGASSITLFLVGHGWVLLLGALACTSLGLARERLDPFAAAAVVWLTVYVFGVNFFIQYLVWILPFLLVIGRLRTVATIQAVMFLPMVIIYAKPLDSELAVVTYAALMITFWVICAVAYALWVVRVTPGPGRRIGIGRRRRGLEITGVPGA